MLLNNSSVFLNESRVRERVFRWRSSIAGRLRHRILADARSLASGPCRDASSSLGDWPLPKPSDPESPDLLPSVAVRLHAGVKFVETRQVQGEKRKFVEPPSDVILLSTAKGSWGPTSEQESRKLEMVADGFPLFHDATLAVGKTTAWIPPELVASVLSMVMMALPWSPGRPKVSPRHMSDICPATRRPEKELCPRPGGAEPCADRTRQGSQVPAIPPAQRDQDVVPSVSPPCDLKEMPPAQLEADRNTFQNALAAGPGSRAEAADTAQKLSTLAAVEPVDVTTVGK